MFNFRGFRAKERLMIDEWILMFITRAKRESNINVKR